MPIMLDSDFGGRWKGGVWRNTPQNTINVEKYTTRICEKSVRRRDTRDGTPSSKGKGEEGLRVEGVWCKV